GSASSRPTVRRTRRPSTCARARRSRSSASSDPRSRPGARDRHDIARARMLADGPDAIALVAVEVFAAADPRDAGARDAITPEIQPPVRAVLARARHVPGVADPQTALDAGLSAD